VELSLPGAKVPGSESSIIHPIFTPNLPRKFRANQFSSLLVILLTKKLASQHRAVSPNWPKIESRRPMVTSHLPWKFHANRSSRLLVMLTNDVKEISIAASRGFSDSTLNWIRSSHNHSAPSLEIARKSVQAFSRNLANKRNKERYKQSKKSIENNTPSPDVSGTG